MNKVNNPEDLSDEELKKRTGMGWEQWINLLDESGIEGMTHKEVAQMIFDKGYCEDTWWCQAIATGVKKRT